MSDSIKGISIVVPFLNEEEAIPFFCKSVDEYVAEIDIPVEIIFVNDGSTDRSLEVLEKSTFSNVSRTIIVDLSKNYGAHSATRAGILYASYDFCTWMGVDLQEPLAFLRIGYDLLQQEGLDVVYFEKKTVKVSPLNRMFSLTYAKLMRKYAVSSFSSNGINTAIFNKKIMNYLNNHIESNSSLLLQIMDLGFKSRIVPLDYKERIIGTSKWTLSKKIKLFVDSFVAFSYMPIRLVSIVGLLILLFGVSIGIVTIINKVANPQVPLGYSTMACLLAIGFGVTNLSLGIIAEYLWRAYDASRNRPDFIVSDVKEITNNTL